MIKSIHVAVTSVGSGIGQSIVQSCRLSNLPFYVVGFDINPLAFGAYDCDAQCTVPRVTSPDYIETVLESCVIHNVSILIPGLDSELLLISGNKKRFEERGISVLVADPAFIGLCRDKILWSRELSARSTAVVPCYYLNELSPLLRDGTLHFPMIAKPKDGSASAGIRIVNSNEQLSDLDESYVIQPYIFPHRNDPNNRTLRDSIERGRFLQVAEISVQYVISKRREILGRMASYNKLKDGVPVEIVPVDDSRIWKSLEDMFPYLYEHGMYGPVNFQGRMTDEGPRFFEMNGRFTGITGLRSMMGFNEVEILIQEFLGMDYGNVNMPVIVNPRRIGMRQVADRTVDPERYNVLKTPMTSYHSYTGQGKNGTLLITGATGWLGRHIVNNVVRRKIFDSIVLLVRDRERAEKTFNTEVTKYLNIVEISEYLHGAWNIGRTDLILHLASGRPPDGADVIAEGLLFTQRCIADAALHQVPAFINISSQSVYGLKRPPLWTESLTVAPDTSYGMSKAASEYMVNAAHRINKSTRATSLRLSRLFGYAEGMRWNELPHQFALRAVRGEKITIRGEKQRFDLIHINDAVDAIIRVLISNPDTWRPVYNLGCGGSAGIMEIAERAIESARNNGLNDSSIELIPSEGSMQFGMSMDLFRQDFDWSPRFSLEQAIDELVAGALEKMD
jgi:nucleoside-diphosphate-sugar epimerase/carbamoylphosphate synthase large subunit